MRNAATNPDPSAPYWAASTVIWPAGFTCTGRKTGSLAHGQTWIVRDDIAEALQVLDKKKSKAEAGIEYVGREIAELEERLAQRNEGEDGALDEVDALINAQRAETYDPHAEEEIYGYDDDLQDDGLSNSTRRPDPPLNVHDYEDPEVLLEEKNRIRTALEDTREDILQQMETLHRNMFHATWGPKAIPAQLARVDAPWLQFAADQQSQSNASAAIEKNKGASSRSTRSETGKRKGKNKKTNVSSRAPDDTPPEDEPAQQKNREYCVKLLSAGVQEASDGRRFFASDAVNDTSAIRPLLLEGEEILRQQWRVVLTLGNGDFEAACLLPLVAVLDVPHSHHATLRDAAFFSPLCVNGSVLDAVGKVAGKRRDYWFQDSLILRNLKATIHSMALLERAGVVHGSIKPSNIYLSGDGANLLIGDFLPPAEMFRWFADLSKKLSNVPVYFSPELYKLLIVSRTKNVTALKSKVNLHKHDVFCLGLTYYYITTRLEPQGVLRDERNLDKALQNLRQEKHDPELVQCLTQMLTFDPVARPSFWDMLNFTEKASIAAQSLISGVKAFFGVADTNEKPDPAGSSDDPTKPTTTTAPKASSSGGGCTVQ